jgi:hypothetical protein
MTASRLYHRERVIPALTDHLEDKGGVDRRSIVGLTFKRGQLIIWGSVRSFAQPSN